jgi:quinol monooxygenase YgiN
VEKFRDEAAFDAHKNSDYIADFFNSVAPALVQEQNVTFHREVLP